MSKQRRSFSPEYQEQIAWMVVEESRAIPSTARDIGGNEQTLRNWVNAYRAARGMSMLSSSELTASLAWRRVVGAAAMHDTAAVPVAAYLGRLDGGLQRGLEATRVEDDCGDPFS